MKIKEVLTPCLLVDIDRVKRNTQVMIDRCQEFGVNLRPNMKTTKTLEAGKLATAGTKRSITVSTVAEAEFYANDGFDDILYGKPTTQDKIPRLKALKKQLKEFHLLIDSQYAVDLLEANSPDDGEPWTVYLKVDCGNQRCGVVWNEKSSIEFAKVLHNSKAISLKGIYSHEGNSYTCRGKKELTETGNTCADRIIDFAKRACEAEVDIAVVGMGSTPLCSNPGDHMKQITEFHPGNYVFHDAAQVQIGSCTESDVAVRVATRVMGHYPHRNELIVDCGFLALSHDGKGMVDRELDSGSWCTVIGHPELKLVKMSQEHGHIEPTSGALDYKKHPIGSMLFFYPYHSCATAAMYPEYLVHSGEDIIDKWIPCRGW